MDVIITNHIWSWPPARFAAVTPAGPTGTNVGANEETSSRARGVPGPRKSWIDRPPRGGVTIRFQEREPRAPLGPASRRHQLHPRSGARRAGPGTVGSVEKKSRWRSASTARVVPTPPPRGTWRVFLRLRTPVFQPPPAPALRLVVVPFGNAGSSLLEAETRKTGAAWRPPLAPRHARAPEPAGTVVPPRP